MCMGAEAGVGSHQYSSRFPAHPALYPTRGAALTAAGAAAGFGKVFLMPWPLGDFPESLSTSGRASAPHTADEAGGANTGFGKLWMALWRWRDFAGIPVRVCPRVRALRRQRQCGEHIRMVARYVVGGGKSRYTSQYSARMYTIKHAPDHWSPYVRSIHHGDQSSGAGRTLPCAAGD
jgi:hypothetical protein